MRALSIVVLIASALLAIAVPARPASAASCTYVLGFKALHDLIPDIVGDCLVDEHHNPTNGDGLQETTGPVGGTGTGLLVWRKADNWTAYTDGYHTWINGPYGIQERLNTGPLFPWEAPSPAAAPTSTPTPAAAVGFVSIQGGPPGGTAAVTFQTSPNVACSIDYVTPHGTDSVAAGLVDKTADTAGHVSWSWVIGSRTIPGTGTVTVTCNGATSSAGITIG